MMTTPFSVVYQRFLNKISDSNLASLTTDILESIMEDYLQSAITRFRKCQQDLDDFDLTSQTFNITLTLDEIEVLANWMKYEWLETQINRIELLKQSLSSKDYAMYSQANHLDKMIYLRKEIYIETNQMITDYTYNFGKLDELR